MRRDTSVQKSLIEVQSEIAAILSQNATPKTTPSFQELMNKVKQSDVMNVGEAVNAALGPQVGHSSKIEGDSLSPGTPARVKAAFSAFFEESGMVLLEPEVPKVEDLVSKYVPALDRFLVASRVNVHEEVDEMSDPRKHRFLLHVKQLRCRFREEVCALSALGKQFCDALGALLRAQSSLRSVSRDEVTLKTMWIHSRFDALLDKILAATRATLVALQRNFLAPYDSDSARKELRTRSVFQMGDEALRVESALNDNFAKPRKATIAQRSRVGGVVLDTDELQEYDDSYNAEEDKRTSLNSVTSTSTSTTGRRDKKRSGVSGSKRWSEEDSTQGSVDAAHNNNNSNINNINTSNGVFALTDATASLRLSPPGSPSSSGNCDPAPPKMVMLKKVRTDNPTPPPPLSLPPLLSTFSEPTVGVTTAAVLWQPQQQMNNFNVDDEMFIDLGDVAPMDIESLLLAL